MRDRCFETLALASLLTAVCAPAQANGLNTIATGLESYAMGGADTAVARDSFALNSNPAGLARVHGLRFDSQGLVVRVLDVDHADAFNVRNGVRNEWIVLSNLGVSYALPDAPVTIGATLAGQGGAGYRYEDLNTAFGTRDDLVAMVRVAKGTIGASWRLNQKLSIGAGLVGFYADANQKLFPDTSALNPDNPASSFFGLEVRDARALGAGVKLGALYELTAALTFGLAYTSASELPFSDGKLIANFGAIGLGKVVYRDMKLSGLNQPQQIEAGAAWQATERLLVSAKVGWIDWSEALSRTVLEARRPEIGAAPPSVTLTNQLAWRDQYVLALGAAWDLDAATTLYAGLNLATQPVRLEHASPILQGWPRTRITGGVRRQISERWHVGIGFDYLPDQHVTYNNPELPFLPASRDNNHYVAALAGLGARW
jgi:long-chain fatty acid transport protein